MNNKMMLTTDRRAENEKLNLKPLELALIAIPKREAADTHDAITIEATLLALDDGAFARLTSAARCGGNGGCSGYDDLALPERWIKCPPYGRA